GRNLLEARHLHTLIGIVLDAGSRGVFTGVRGRPFLAAAAAGEGQGSHGQQANSWRKFHMIKRILVPIGRSKRYRLRVKVQSSLCALRAALAGVGGYGAKTYFTNIVCAAAYGGVLHKEFVAATYVQAEREFGLRSKA
nr:hypothetical protein [Tanacetum cinerariifolium]